MLGNLNVDHLAIASKKLNVLDVLPHCDRLVYPNIYRLLHILATLPVSSCESERTFSSLK